MALMDAIAYAKTRVEDLNTSIQEQRTKKQEYATFISQQSLSNAHPSLYMLHFLRLIFIWVILPSGCIYLLYNYNYLI